MFQRAISAVILLFSLFLLEVSASEPTREYPFSYGEPLDSRIIVRTSIALNKLGYDFYGAGLSPLLPEWLDPWTETAWSIFWTMNLTLWPHDFGHWVRANQAGGDFVIDAYGFPFPQARMIIPATATLSQITLMSGGGFEINTLMRKYTEDRFFQTGYRDVEDMVHSFIQSMLFPLYTLVVAPIDPNSDPNTWYGDPSDYAKLVFENYTGRSPVLANNKPDPGLVSLYQEMFWVNLLVNAIDPWMYIAAEAFTRDLKDRSVIDRLWLFSSKNFSWAYTTRFNTGVLGYEVYLTQHIELFDRYFSLYVREGRPFKNHGIGVRIPAVIEQGDFSLDTTLDAWDQDNYGVGGMIGLSPGYRVGKNLRLSLDLHWKSAGYVTGLPVEQELGWLLNGTLYLE